MTTLIADIDMTMSPKDHMLTANKEAYVRTSISGLRAVQNAVTAANKTPETVKNILDFGSGYGRVLRALKAGYPNAQLTACDLMPDAIQFCSETFDVTPIQGRENVKETTFPVKYDVIWVGSVFTHLPVERWAEFLEFFEENLAPNGVLVFSTHGRTALWVFENHTLSKSHMDRDDFDQVKKNYTESGYCFYNYSSKHTSSLSDLGITVSDDAYGLSFTRPDWLCNYMLRHKNYFISSYAEGGWGRNHDVVGLWLPSDPRDI